MRLIRLFPARLRAILWIGLLFMLVNLLVRAGLLIFDARLFGEGVLQILATMALGFAYDLVTLAWVLLPFVALTLVWTNGSIGRIGHALSASALLVLGLFAMLVTAAAEGMFWNEFAARFNFIAVDYLIYTREVFGNIRESFPLGWILGALALGALVLFGLVARPFWRLAAGDAGTPWRRIAAALGLLAAAFALSVLPLDAARELLASTTARDLAGNGYFEFIRAFRDNDLDYRAFYRTMSREAVAAELGREYPHSRIDTSSAHRGSPIQRLVAPVPIAGHPALNLVLVSMESLGADYVESLGGRAGLTPNLDALGREGLNFTQLYATGLRTVRGLEALTLSLPPTPGHAVPTRPNNKGLQSLGGVLAARGYDALYLYGGYSYFDNMRDFFGGNGYTVIDRSDIPASAISHETIWGVADEDLFAQALREIDQRAGSATPVFAHIMTTSNHRPFTYPDGRIDIRSGSGREGAVKYSDWAIGQFIAQARRRPWFANTVFIFVADHTSNGRGRTDLPPENFRIPCIVYAPGLIRHADIDLLSSQIDVAPTALGLLGIGYESSFFGHDILRDGAAHPRAFFANYLTVGYFEEGLVVELGPKRSARVIDAASSTVLASDDPRALRLVNEAIAFYQSASDLIARDTRATRTADAR